MGFWTLSSTSVQWRGPVHTLLGSGEGTRFDVGAAWCAVRLERLVRNVDGRQDSGRDDGCPRWCAGEHDEIPEAGDRLHRSPARSIPAVIWTPDQDDGDPSAAVVHVSVCRPGAAAEDRLRFEADGLGAIDLDLGSAARLLRAAQATLGLLDPAAP